MKKFILLCGASGTGKTTLANNLVDQDIFKDIKFHNLKQVTTRPMRDDEVEGESYFFLNEEQYDQKKDNLIAKTKFYGNRYGTIDTSVEYNEQEKNNVNIIVVNKEGRNGAFNDIKEKYKENEVLTIQLVNDNLEVMREGRSKQDILKEAKELDEITDIKMINCPGNWISINEFIETLKINDFIK